MRLGMERPLDAEGARHILRGDVVMRRADAAGGEEIVELGAQLVDGGDDRVGDVGDDARLAQGHADLVEADGDVVEVGVLRAAGEDLVADDQDGGGNDLLGTLRRSAHAGLPGPRAAAPR